MQNSILLTFCIFYGILWPICEEVNFMNKKRAFYKADMYRDIRQMLAAVAVEYPNNAAFIIKQDKAEYKRITYRRLVHDIQKLGTALVHANLPRKRIAIIGGNRYEWMLSYLAVLCGAGMAVPLDRGLSETEILSLLPRSAADLVIFDPKYADIFRRLSQSGTHDITAFICMETCEGFASLADFLADGEKRLSEGDRTYLDAPLYPEEAGVMLFTSGTTARSKAVLLSQKNFLSNIYGMCRTQKFYPTDVNMAFLPFHHTFGSVGTLIFLAHGATTVFCDGLRYVSQNLKEYGVTVFVGVPLIIEGIYKKIMLTVKKQRKEKKLAFGRALSRMLLAFRIDKRRKIFSDIHAALGGKMRYIISGASALSPEVSKAFNDFGITTVQGYGLTETAPVIAAENVRCRRRGSVGMPLCNVELKIDAPDSRGIGEILVKGPNVMEGYYEDAEATNAAFRDGWFCTGDLGRQDADGVLYITGRKKNVIVLKNGKNIYPEEIESLINTLPYVRESMVYGKEKGDDFIVSVRVVYDTEYFKGKEKEEIESAVRAGIASVNAKMAKHQYIKYIEVTDEPMEKTTTEKIKRYKAAGAKDNAGA